MEGRTLERMADGAVIIHEVVCGGSGTFRFGTWAEFEEHLRREFRQFEILGKKLSQDLEFVTKVFSEERQRLDGKSDLKLSSKVRQFIEGLEI